MAAARAALAREKRPTKRRKVSKICSGRAGEQNVWNITDIPVPGGCGGPKAYFPLSGAQKNHRGSTQASLERSEATASICQWASYMFPVGGGVNGGGESGAGAGKAAHKTQKS